MSLADAKAVSHRYFELHEQILIAKKAGAYRDVARLSCDSYRLLPSFVAAYKREYGRWDIQHSFAVRTGSIILAVLEDEEGLRLLQQTLSGPPDLKPWQPVGEAAVRDMNLVKRMMAAVAATPGVLQSDLGAGMPMADKRRLATLAAWLEKAQRIRRVRAGKTYAISIA